MSKPKSIAPNARFLKYATVAAAFDVSVTTVRLGRREFSELEITFINGHPRITRESFNRLVAKVEARTARVSPDGQLVRLAEKAA